MEQTLLSPTPETRRMRKLQAAFDDAFPSLVEARANTVHGPEEAFKHITVKVAGGVQGCRLVKGKDGLITDAKEAFIGAYDLTQARRAAVQAEGLRVLDMPASSI